MIALLDTKCGAKYDYISLTLYCVNSLLNASTTDSFENTVGKEEIARNEQFLLFPQCFLLNQKLVSPFVNIYDIISLLATELEEPKIGILGKGLNSFFFFSIIQVTKGL